MSHDRGCPCGKEEYVECYNKIGQDCIKSGLVEYWIDKGQITHIKKKEKMAKKVNDILGDFDFGFSAVDDATEEVQTKDSEINRLTEQRDALYNILLPLLDNLAKNPEKEMIKWPNRDKVINEVKGKIEEIMR